MRCDWWRVKMWKRVEPVSGYFYVCMWHKAMCLTEFCDRWWIHTITGYTGLC